MSITYSNLPALGQNTRNRSLLPVKRMQPQPIVPLVGYDTDNESDDINLLYLIPEYKHTESSSKY